MLPNPADFDEQVGELVDRVQGSRLPTPADRARIREAAGLSLEEMARPIGVSPLTLLRWERGSMEPRRDNALRYRRVLDAVEGALRAAR